MFLLPAFLFTGFIYAQNDSVTKSLNETYPSYQRYNSQEYVGIWPEKSPVMTIFMVSLLSLIILGLIILVIRKSKGYGSTTVIGGLPRGSRGTYKISSSSIYSKRKKRGSSSAIGGGGYGGVW